MIKGYGVRATMIEGQNTFAPALCFAKVSCERGSKHAWPDYEWSKVQTYVIKVHSVHSIHS